MEFPESLDEAAEHARQALPLMSKNRVAASPLNYAIWYAYVAGKSEGLQLAIDKQLQAGSGFDNQISQQLYEKFISDCKPNSLEGSRSRLTELMTTVIQDLVASGVDATHCTRALANYSDKLDTDPSQADLRKIIAGVTQQTRQIETTGTRLEQQLAATSSEVEALRLDLERIKREAATDGLTGLYNRRTFDQRLDSLLVNGGCLVLADIDHFKQFNDTHGHIVGDQVIRFVASILTRHSSREDIPARFGGEEFAIIMPGTKLPAARNLAETIRTHIANSTLKKAGSEKPLGTVTVSLGVAKTTRQDTAESLIQRVDQALYHSKHMGRNRVTTAQETPSSAVG